jgi:hypothetical protein
MRNVLAITVSVFLLIVSGGYVMTWYIQAAQTRTLIENAIARINAKHPLLTYAAIETSGFPKDVTVSIIKPRFSGRIDELLKELAPTPAWSNLPQWSEDITLDGSIAFTVNALSNRYAMTINGGWSSQDTLGDKVIALHGQSKGNVVCVLELERFGLFTHMWDFTAIERNKDAIMSEFRLFDCSAAGSTISETASGETIMENGPTRFYVSKSAQYNNTQQLRFYLKAADSEITAKGDEIFKHYFDMLSPDRPVPLNWSVYGKQNIEIDMDYAGPGRWNTLQPKDAVFAVNVNKFDITNNVYRTDFTLHVSNAVAGDIITSRLAFNAHSIFSEHYDTLVRGVVRGIIADMYKNKDNVSYDLVKPLMEKYTPEQAYALAEPIIPNFFSLGKMTQAMDVQYEGKNYFSSGNVTLASMELSAAPYGITGKGAGKIIQGSPIPAANLNLLCSNCLRLVDDMAAYGERLQRFAQAGRDELAPPATLDPRLVEGIKTLLTTIGKPADASALAFDFSSDGAGNFVLNGKNIAEVMTLYSQLVAPYLQKPEAAAPAPAAPAVPAAPKAPAR